MIYRFAEKPINHCATLLGDIVGKETIYEITLDLILTCISINTMSHNGGLPNHLRKIHFSFIFHKYTHYGILPGILIKELIDCEFLTMNIICL